MNEDHPRRTGIHPEMLVGISAVVIGLCALAVSMYETSLMRQEQRSAVMPILELARSYNISSSDPENNRLWLIAQNVGIGPARVMDFRVTVDGQPQPDWTTAIQALIGNDERVSHSQSVINGRTLPPDRTVRMFELKDPELAIQINAQLDRMKFQACYCSIFDECWIATNSSFGFTEAVEILRVVAGFIPAIGSDQLN